jgi:hypothetical protein
MQKLLASRILPVIRIGHAEVRLLKEDLVDDKEPEVKKAEETAELSELELGKVAGGNFTKFIDKASPTGEPPPPPPPVK